MTDESKLSLFLLQCPANLSPLRMVLAFGQTLLAPRESHPSSSFTVTFAQAWSGLSSSMTNSCWIIYTWYNLPHHLSKILIYVLLQIKYEVI